MSLDFTKRYEAAFGAGTRNAFAGYSNDAVALLAAAIPEAVKKAMYGTPGPSYLDLPGDIITGRVDEDTFNLALALAQIAALGATFALTLGYNPDTESWKIALFSLVFTFAGAGAFSQERATAQYRGGDARDHPPHRARADDPCLADDEQGDEHRRDRVDALPEHVAGIVVTSDRRSRDLAQLEHLHHVVHVARAGKQRGALNRRR